ncbi:hypothetical protein C6Y11_17335 [Lactiplantibacillus pentosus]|uniref:helix-turn-helix domain-containing protein n=1 Tax=Lactiplantibacillus pentosus TaxID=1589 RepID=UPI000D0223E1|nr:helix-turn-helix transcriptional regulator [Lactiplantibacillus pentosus]PRO75667.1 hypothetical protein C6Y11_17335 [Lactiplantibacillus pentosus]PRO79076.1 hypothetical protein C6Y09_12560 [Lactiplantibacillus pentosus]PRO87385.1 hypothetical protein C6Y12_17975 [Lactiplantibacillus pentosus]
MRRFVYRELKGWLVAHNISQGQVAELLGTKTNYINKKLNGTGSDFRLSEARKMHDELGVPMVYFFEIVVPLKERSANL